MEPAGSTLVARPGDGVVLRRWAERTLGGSQLPPEKLAALLLPMVRRAVRTERGPSALVGWLRRRAAREDWQAEPTVQVLTEDLVRALGAPLGAPDDTLDDA
ncbi:hypothetical protein VT84_03040 [Gemmata sp. SH-PL17]|uniref:hypothetical protein n=1 Tax=Gemmata sp. SH-PL17 TaxID=1630693 RepID=UPI00078E4753|nr:hypothetical protein [Gemmata sp. SH-PL17]AMV23357.1 hypothetical protein VT84_03040 [Gemmata sp. SH-PL17]